MMNTPFFIPLDGSPSSFSGSTLVIPAVSIGSVPQLAIDLLLHHAPLALRKVGRIDPTFCFPFIGPSDSAGDHDLTTALEVFSNGTLTLIQQRSPVLKTRAKEYISALTAWIVSSGFSETLWLSSIEAADRTDEEYNTPILHLLPSPSSVVHTPVLKQLAALFPAFNPPAPGVVPGSLLTAKLMKHVASLDEENKSKLGALLYFAAEGDTKPDAHVLATLTLSLLLPQQESPLLTEPRSWNALFGAPANPHLYA